MKSLMFLCCCIIGGILAETNYDYNDNLLNTNSYQFNDEEASYNQFNHLTGFKDQQTESRNDLPLSLNTLEGPQSVTDTPAVKLARQQHLAIYGAALKGEYSQLLPQPVKDTAEVVEAKRQFFERYNYESQRNEYLRNAVLFKYQQLPREVLLAPVGLPGNIKTYTSPLKGFAYHVAAAPLTLQQLYIPF